MGKAVTQAACSRAYGPSPRDDPLSSWQVYVCTHRGPCAHPPLSWPCHGCKARRAHLCQRHGAWRHWFNPSLWRCLPTWATIPGLLGEAEQEAARRPVPWELEEVKSFARALRVREPRGEGS